MTYCIKRPLKVQRQNNWVNRDKAVTCFFKHLSMNYISHQSCHYSNIFYKKKYALKFDTYFEITV